MSSRKRKMVSPAWDYFKSEQEGSTRFGICQIEGCTSTRVKCTGGTSNLISHLEVHHKEIHALIIPHLASKPTKKTKTCTSQSTRLLDLTEEIDSDLESLAQGPSVSMESTSKDSLLGDDEERSLSRSSSTYSGSFCQRIWGEDTSKPYPNNGQRMRNILRAFVIFIARALLPLSFIENPHFLQFLRVVDSRIKMPSRSTLTNKLLPELYEEAKQKLLSILADAKSVSLTTDIWSSKTGYSYMTVTAHFIRVVKGYKMQLDSKVLNTVYLPGTHDAAAIYKTLTDIASSWGILDKVIAVVTDNAANMKAAVNLSQGKWLHVPCFAHTLNLLVKNSFESNLEVTALLTTCRQIVTVFKTSTKAMSYLRDFARANPDCSIETIKQDVPTRWNSTLTMIRSILNLGEALDDALRVANRSDLVLLEYEKELLKNLLSILQYFEEATEELSSQFYPSLSKVIPIVKQLQDSIASVELDPGSVAEVRDKLHEGLIRRFRTDPDGVIASENVETIPSKYMATFLDPRYKKAYFSTLAANSCENGVIGEVNALSRVTPSADEQTATGSDPLQPANADNRLKKRNLLRQAREKIAAEENKKMAGGANRTASVIVLMKLFNSYPLVKDDSCPLKWWSAKKRDNLMVPLFSVVEKYFCIPATSVPSEQVFSIAGLLLCEKRSCLSHDNVDMLLFLNKNA